MQCVFILLALTTNPFLHQNQPSRESFFCGRMGVWWITRALTMLKFVLKNRHFSSWWVDGKMSWWEDELMERRVDGRTSWRENGLKGVWVDGGTSWWEDELMGERVEGSASWWGNELMERRVDGGRVDGGRVRTLRGESIFSPLEGRSYFFIFSSLGVMELRS